MKRMVANRILLTCLVAALVLTGAGCRHDRFLNSAGSSSQETTVAVHGQSGITQQTESPSSHAVAETAVETTGETTSPAAADGNQDLSDLKQTLIDLGQLNDSLDAVNEKDLVQPVS